jgi:hypothetical protein
MGVGMSWGLNGCYEGVLVSIGFEVKEIGGV